VLPSGRSLCDDVSHHRLGLRVRVAHVAKRALAMAVMRRIIGAGQPVANAVGFPLSEIDLSRFLFCSAERIELEYGHASISRNLYGMSVANTSPPHHRIAPYCQYPPFIPRFWRLCTFRDGFWVSYRQLTYNHISYHTDADFRTHSTRATRWRFLVCFRTDRGGPMHGMKL